MLKSPSTDSLAITPAPLDPPALTFTAPPKPPGHAGVDGVTGLAPKAPSLKSESTSLRKSLSILREPGSKSASFTPPFPEGPVFDPATGDLNLKNLERAAYSLVSELPPLPTNASPSQTRLKARVAAQLNQIMELAETGERKPPHQLGLELRHACKAASRTASALASSLASSDRDLGLEYALMAAIFNEMKRTHLSGAAKHVVEEYAERQTKHLNEVVPGMGEKRAGSLLISSKGAGASWGPNLPAEVMGFDIGGAGAKNLLGFVDDQNSVFLQEYASGHAEGNLFGSVGKWNGKARFRAGTHYIGNDCVGTRMVGGPDLKDVVKVFNDVQAENAWVKSAGPKLQKTLRNYQRARNALTTTVLGRAYAKEPGAPTYLSQSKLAKGFNSTKMQVLVEAVEDLRRDKPNAGKLRELARTAYPPLHEAIAEARDNNTSMPKFGIHNSLPKEAFYGHAYGPFASAKFSASKTLDKDTIEARGLQTAVMLDWDTLVFPNWLPHLAHQALDFSFSKDAAQTMLVHAKLDKLVGPHAPDAPPPELHLYSAVARHLGGREALGVQTDPGLDPADRTYYQGLANREVPTQFIEGILEPSADKLVRAADVAIGLGELRLQFVEQAHTLTAKPERSWPLALRNKLQRKREAAFDAVNEQVWGGCYPGGKKAALKNPEKFVAATHGALSLAFGAAGTHLSIQKRQMQDRGMTSAGDGQLVGAVDALYKEAREVFDHDNLNVSQQRLAEGKNTALNVYQMFRRHTVGATVSVSGGWEANTIQAAAQATGSTTVNIPVDVPVDGTHDSASATSRIGTGTLTLRGKWQKMDLQDSASRQGDYLQLDLTGVCGAPLMGQLLQDLTGSFLEKLGLRQNDDARLAISDAIRQAGSMGLSIEDGAKVAIRYRQAPGNKGFDLEYVRPLKVKDHGLLASVKIAMPEHVVQPSVASIDHVEVPGSEILGPDLYYLIAQHGKLKKALAQHDGSVRKTLAARPDLVTGYCGSPVMIPTVIDRYRLAMDPAQPAPPAERNEFHRFFKDPQFERASQVANDVKSHSPGSRANAADPFEEPARLSDPVRFPPGFDWAAAKTQIAALKTPEARAAYYARGEGKKVFNAFVAIIDKTAAVDAAASMHHDSSRTFGFYSELNPKLKKVAKDVDKRASGATPGIASAVSGALKATWPFKSKAADGPQYPFGKLPAAGPLGAVFMRQGATPAEVAGKGKAKAEET